MKHYHISSNDSQFGPYPEDQIVTMVTSNQIQRTDLCWAEGMENWTPIQSVIPLPPTLPPPVPVPQHQQSLSPSEPWFLYIPIPRLIFMSLITFGLYDAYWIYKNWGFLKKRDGLKIMPFWRGIFGIFFIYGILKEIKNDGALNSQASAQFSAGALATGYIIQMFIGETLGVADDIRVLLFSALLSVFTFLFLLPAQNFINQANESRAQRPNHTPWTTGHVVVLIVGLIYGGLIFIGVVAPE